jgi:hypothetical protein
VLPRGHSSNRANYGCDLSVQADCEVLYESFEVLDLPLPDCLRTTVNDAVAKLVESLEPAPDRGILCFFVLSSVVSFVVILLRSPVDLRGPSHNTAAQNSA